MGFNISFGGSRQKDMNDNTGYESRHIKKLKSKGTLIVSLILGIVFAGVGVLFIVLTNNGIKNGVKVQAEIVSYTSRMDDGDMMYCAVYEYKVNGKIYQAASKTSSSVKPKIGKKVTIWYNKNDPTKITENNSWIGYIFAGIGGFITVAGVTGYFVLRKKEKEAK